AHPQDEGANDGDTSLYMGASGVIWALDHLTRTAATRHRRTIVPCMDDARIARGICHLSEAFGCSHVFGRSAGRLWRYHVPMVGGDGKPIDRQRCYLWCLKRHLSLPSR